MWRETRIETSACDGIPTMIRALGAAMSEPWHSARPQLPGRRGQFGHLGRESQQVGEHEPLGRGVVPRLRRGGRDAGVEPGVGATGGAPSGRGSPGMPRAGRPLSSCRDPGACRDRASRRCVGSACRGGPRPGPGPWGREGAGRSSGGDERGGSGNADRAGTVVRVRPIPGATGSRRRPRKPGARLWGVRGRLAHTPRYRRSGGMK